MVLRKPHILFVHHTAMWYRKPFFRMLSKEYPIKFLFTNVEGYNKTYSTSLSHEIEGMEGVDYEVVKNYLGVAWGAIKATWGDYDIFVGGSWDKPTDVIETLLYFLFLKIRRKKFILWREDWDWNVKTTKRSLVKILAGFLGRHADAVLVPGTKHKKFFTNLGVSDEKIFIMPNVSNMQAKPEDEKNSHMIREKWNLNQKTVVLFVGRLIDLKGVNYLLEAIKGLRKDLVLLILGDGPEMDNLKKLSQQLQIEDQVIFMGNIDNDLLGAYYSAADLFILPSITTYYADACPLVVNEAMYFNLPVITSDAVGTTFMIKEGVNGYVVPEKNSLLLKEAIEKITSNNKTMREMGKASKTLIDNGFQYKNMLQGFQKAIDYVQKK